jgi:hypothetical protein
VFARLANGNAQTVRRIEGQQTHLHRPIHAIFYDEIHDEIFIPIGPGQAILTFRGSANGEEAPIRIIQGPKTELTFTDILGADPVHNEILVPAVSVDGTSMLHVFDRAANGNVAPIRKLGGPNANLGGGIPSVAWDHDLLLARAGRRTDGLRAGGGIHIFNRTASGDARPLRSVTGGPKSGTSGPGTPVWIPGTRNFLADTRPFDAPPPAPGTPNNYQSAEEAQTFIGVWSIDDSGDVAPRYTIAHNLLKEFRNLTIDPKNRTVMIADKTANSIYTLSFPEAWESFAPVTAQTN